MENHYKEMLRFQLMEEVAKISARVTALGTPNGTMERSLIARYGKLLFVTQQLMDTLPHLLEVSAKQGLPSSHTGKSQTSVIPRPENGSFSRRFDLV